MIARHPHSAILNSMRFNVIFVNWFDKNYIEELNKFYITRQLIY